MLNRRGMIPTHVIACFKIKEDESSEENSGLQIICKCK